jgi:NAD(P)-dependent dehydrogenase (short-subunit alcohol dehydrogenase family)
MALRSSAEGASIVVADRRLDAAKGTVELIESSGGSALATETDVSQADQVEAMAARALEAYGQVDVLVNNAGLSVGDAILDFDEAAWDLNLDVVLKAVYLCSRALLPQMIERGSGVILNIASVNGLMAIGESAYSAAKAGMISLTGNMAIHYGNKGIRVNCIAPGTIKTPIWDERLAQTPDAMDHIVPWYPLGRVGTPEDVAKAALFLCSDDASWITGVTLPVDGGLMAGSYMLNKALQGVQ